MAYVRRKLSECETITDFILAVVNLLHEVEAFQESELGAKRPDPEVIARVILGFRPKRFVSKFGAITFADKFLNDILLLQHHL